MYLLATRLLLDATNECTLLWLKSQWFYVTLCGLIRISVDLF